MEAQIEDIPYQSRVKVLSSGFTLIWPFRNLPKGRGPYELFLDNNALVHTSWLKDLGSEFRNKIIVSPTLALAEQWLSNQRFQSNPKERVKDFVAPFIKAGIKFPSNYASIQAESLAKNETAWRTQWMLTYLYVVLLYRITKARAGDTIPNDLLAHLKYQDVPMFNGCIMLCCLASYLSSNQSAHLVGDDKAAYSYLNSFISLHGKAKGESEFDENYLRNRAGDLSIWCMAGALYHNGFRPAGEPVIVTQDKALSRLIFRCLPGYMYPNGQMAFSFDERTFEPLHATAIEEHIRATVSGIRQPVGRDEQLRRMDTLRTYVTQAADAQLVAAVDQTWERWLKPGFHESFQ